MRYENIIINQSNTNKIYYLHLCTFYSSYIYLLITYANTYLLIYLNLHELIIKLNRQNMYQK